MCIYICVYIYIERTLSDINSKKVLAMIRWVSWDGDPARVFSRLLQIDVPFPFHVWTMSRPCP